MVSPRSIAVDPNYGLLFWSDWQTDDPSNFHTKLLTKNYIHNTGKKQICLLIYIGIERASMSGKFRKKVFNVGSSGEGIR